MDRASTVMAESCHLRSQVLESLNWGFQPSSYATFSMTSYWVSARLTTMGLVGFLGEVRLRMLGNSIEAP